MPQYNLIARPGQLLSDQANARLESLLEDLQSPNIQSVNDLLGKISQVFVQFYNNLGAPLSTPFQFVGLPIAELWNTYQELVADDIGILYNQTNEIQQAAVNAGAFAAIEISMLTNAVASIVGQVTGFNPTNPVGTGLQSWVVSDTFVDSSKVNISSSSQISVINNQVELQTVSSTNFANQIQLFVDDEFVSLVDFGNANQVDIGLGSSNGYPGTTHEVVVTENTNPLTSSSSSSSSNSIDQIVQLNATPGSSISFVGDTGINSDLSVVLDGDPTTWFEYECCNFPDALKVNPCNGYGLTLNIPPSQTQTPLSVPWYAFHQQTTPFNETSFFPSPPSTSNEQPAGVEVDNYGNYLLPNGNSADPTSISTLNIAASGGTISIESVGAPQSGGALILVLTGYFPTPQILNQIQILPYVIQNLRAKTISIQVQSEDQGVWIDATPLQVDNSGSLISATSSNITVNTVPDVFQLPQTAVKYIRIVIEQTSAYQTQIGHYVWLNESTNATTNTDPTLLNSVLGTNLYQDQQDSTSLTYTRIDGPAQDLSLILNTQSGVINTLDTTSFSSQQNIIGPLIESFNGWRYAIGIRDISFLATTYVSTGTMISKNFTVPIDIKTVTLDTSELQPTGDQLINYSFSLDGGTTWNAIAPSNQFNSSSPTSYQVNPIGGPSIVGNQNTIISTTNYNASTNPVNTICLRAIFTQPNSNTSITPRLLGYNINLQGVLLT